MANFLSNEPMRDLIEGETDRRPMPKPPRSAGQEAEIIKITDIAGHGVMATPALMIDGRLVSSGIVLTAKEIGQLL
ncbi:thioredoxin family protein [Frigidibacter albus]|nr:thioredoxin family protein [Frigidibacter albus]